MNFVIYRVSKKIYLMNILQIFYQWLGIFLKLLQAYYLSIFTFNFNQLTVNLTKLCYMKRDNLAIFHNTLYIDAWNCIVYGWITC